MTGKTPNKRVHIKSSESFINEKNDSKKPELQEDLISDSDSDSDYKFNLTEKNKFRLLKNLKVQKEHGIFKLLVVEKHIVKYISKQTGYGEKLVKLKLMDSERNYIDAIIFNSVLNQVSLFKLENVNFIFMFFINYSNFYFYLKVYMIADIVLVLSKSKYEFTHEFTIVLRNDTKIELIEDDAMLEIHYTVSLLNELSNRAINSKINIYCLYVSGEMKTTQKNKQLLIINIKSVDGVIFQINFWEDLAHKYIDTFHKHVLMFITNLTLKSDTSKY
jgi:hypothetical protein